MPRTPRLDFPGARHHVMNRALRHQDLLTDDATCALFLDAVADTPLRFDAKIHGYALMPNHYHLLVEVPRGNLSDVMKHIGAVFTQAYNRAHGQDGPVFRGRFKNQVVEDDAYWMHLLAYLHLNPVKAHLATRPEDCIWTSHNAYLHPEQAPDWLTREEMVALFGSTKVIQGYIEDIHVKRREPPENFDADRLWHQPATTTVPAQAPASRTASEAIADVARICGVPVDTVRNLPRGRTPNREAWLTVWWLLQSTTLSQGEIAPLMGVSRTRISQLLKKFHELAARDPQVRAWRNALERERAPA